MRFNLGNSKLWMWKPYCVFIKFSWVGYYHLSLNQCLDMLLAPSTLLIFSLPWKDFSSQNSKYEPCNSIICCNLTRKSFLKINDYILKMWNIVDTLLAFGKIISNDDLTLYILGSLILEYNFVIVNITSRSDNTSLQEMQFLL